MRVHGKALATIEPVDDDDLTYGPNGGFTAVLSTPSQDRDGDSLLREEWQDLPDHCTLDMDHGMTVATTIGSFTPFWGDDGALMMRAAFSSIPRAQEARTLVKEGHVRDVSVAFLTDKSKKSGEARRELLNAGIVGIGSNRDAKILDSKALDARAEEIIAERETKAPEPYGHVHYADPEDGKYPIDTIAHIRAALSYINVQHNYDALGDHAAHVKRAIEAAARAHGIHVADSRSIDGETSVYVDVIPRLDYDGFAKTIAEAFTKASGGDSPALTQAIHDASVHLGATCYPIQVEGPEDPSGAPSGANKSIDEAEVQAEVVAEEEQPIPDDSPLGQWLGSFEKRLTEFLIGEKSPAEPPAEAAAASDEEPAPADDAAEKAADDYARQAELLQMQMALL